ncbi:conserved hypothetical protein [Cupriavidus taiwanensis]|nr:conserved hypothetical protein [Cupriavidus taiwanensis]SOY81272.1 conserved hypothetical protein [Cupriavidus taiwanensis]
MAAARAGGDPQRVARGHALAAGRLFLRRAADGGATHLELVYRRARYLPASGRDPDRDRAGLRHRHGGGARRRPVAGAEPAYLGHPRSLRQGHELDAARDPGADLRGLVRPGHLVEGCAGSDAGVLHRLLQRLPGRQGSEPGGAGQCAHAGRQPEAAAAPCLPAERDQLGVLVAAYLGGAGLRRRGGGRVPGLGARRGLPDPAGRGHLRHQYRVRRHRGADRICAGAGLDGRHRREAADEVAAEDRGDGEALTLASVAVCFPLPQAGEGVPKWPRTWPGAEVHRHRQFTSPHCLRLSFSGPAPTRQPVLRCPAVVTARSRSCR